MTSRRPEWRAGGGEALRSPPVEDFVARLGRDPRLRLREIAARDEMYLYNLAVAARLRATRRRSSISRRAGRSPTPSLPPSGGASDPANPRHAARLRERIRPRHPVPRPSVPPRLEIAVSEIDPEAVALPGARLRRPRIPLDARRAAGFAPGRGVRRDHGGLVLQPPAGPRLRGMARRRSAVFSSRGGPRLLRRTVPTLSGPSRRIGRRGSSSIRRARPRGSTETPTGRPGSLSGFVEAAAARASRRGRARSRRRRSGSAGTRTSTCSSGRPLRRLLRARVIPVVPRGELDRPATSGRESLSRRRAGPRRERRTSRSGSARRDAMSRARARRPRRRMVLRDPARRRRPRRRAADRGAAVRDEDHPSRWAR